MCHDVLANYFKLESSKVGELLVSSITWTGEFSPKM